MKQSARHADQVRGRGRGIVIAAVMVAVCAAGCVQRRMTIRSNPPGAFVYVDEYPIGTTPVSTDYVYYGRRNFRLVRDGYETLHVEQKVAAPWYQWFGIDFISENLIPYNIRDERTIDFQMAPQKLQPAPQLTARAEELRASSQAQRYVPVTPANTLAPGAASGPIAVPPPPATVPPGYPAAPPPGYPAAPPPGYPTAPPPGYPATLPPGQPQYMIPPPAVGPGVLTPPPVAPQYLPPGVPRGAPPVAPQ